jgi:hypothetical protein
MQTLQLSVIMTFEDGPVNTDMILKNMSRAMQFANSEGELINCAEEHPGLCGWIIVDEGIRPHDPQG